MLGKRRAEECKGPAAEPQCQGVDVVVTIGDLLKESPSVGDL